MARTDEGVLSPQQSRLVEQMLAVAHGAELENGNEDFALVAFSILGLAISKLPEGPDRELFLAGIEQGALRHVVSNYEHLAESRGGPHTVNSASGGRSDGETKRNSPKRDRVRRSR
jgi:hypothetical protein